MKKGLLALGVVIAALIVIGLVSDHHEAKEAVFRQERAEREAAERAERDAAAKQAIEARAAQFSVAEQQKAIRAVDASIRNKEFGPAMYHLKQIQHALAPVLKSSRSSEPEIQKLDDGLKERERTVSAALDRQRAQHEPGIAGGSASTCGTMRGDSPKDLENVRAFCAAAVPADLGVVGVQGMQSLLWIQIPRALANIMLADRLTSEQVVKNWMAAWKRLSGSKAVTVYVKWQDVEIAKGDTSIFSGDVVTFK